mgnify:CR=1 FL=1
MKRTWFAILFLLLVAGLCIFEQHTVKTTFENMETVSYTHLTLPTIA